MIVLNLEANILTERKLRNINVFWRDILSTYKSFIDTVKPKNMYEIMSTPLWCNKNIKVGGNTVFYTTWSDNGIMCLSDLFSVNGQILSYEEFRLKYNFQTNFLEFYISVRQYVSSFNFHHGNISVRRWPHQTCTYIVKTRFDEVKKKTQ